MSGDWWNADPVVTPSPAPVASAPAASWWSSDPVVTQPSGPLGVEKLKAAFARGDKPNDDAVRRGGIIRDLAGVPKATATDAAVQGATMGWSDELGAAATAPIDMVKNGESYSEAYANNLARERERLARYKTENPGTALAAELAGSFAMKPVTGTGEVLAAAPGLFQRVKEGVKFGAPVGFVTGAGHADGDVSDRLSEGVKGAEFGTALGAGLPLATAAVRTIAAPITNLIKGTVAPETRATEAIRRDMTRDGVTPAAARAELDAAQQTGAPMTLGDLGGRNTMGLARAVATGKGEGSAQYNAFLDARRLDAPDRIVDNVRSALANPEAFYPTLDRIIAERKAVAGPLYQQAYAQPMPDSQVIKTLLATPAGKQAVRTAEKLSANEGIPFTQDVRGLDLVKRAMDDMIDRGVRAGSNNEVRILTGLKNQLVKEVDRNVPVYRQAREAYSSRAELEEAIEAGRSLLKPGIDAEVAMPQIARMSASEKEVARIGMARELKSMFDDPSRMLSSLNKLLYSDRLKRITQELFPSSQAFEQFRSGLGREALMARRAREIQGNSSTANKLSDIEDAGFAGAAVDAVTGHPLRAGMSVATNVVDKLRRGLNEKTANRLGGLFAETDPLKQRAILDAIEKALPPGALDRLLGIVGTRAGALAATR